MFEHLHLLWMGIWLHTHTSTTTDVSKDSGELADNKILDYVKCVNHGTMLWLCMVQHYIDIWCTTIVTSVVAPIFEECQQGEKGCCSMPRLWWWEQVTDLDVSNAIGYDNWWSLLAPPIAVEVEDICMDGPIQGDLSKHEWRWLIFIVWAFKEDVLVGDGFAITCGCFPTTWWLSTRLTVWSHR